MKDGWLKRSMENVKRDYAELPDWLKTPRTPTPTAQEPMTKERESMNDLERGFHNRDGWFFRRDSEDGNVRIWKVRYERAFWPCTKGCPPFHQHQADCPAAEPPHFVSVLEAGPHTIPENEWASIVASVSRGGETGTSWQFVRNFHNGGCKHD